MDGVPAGLPDPSIDAPAPPDETGLRSDDCPMIARCFAAEEHIFAEGRCIVAN